MTNWQKIGIGILIIATLAVIKYMFFPSSSPEQLATNEEQQVQEPTQKTEQDDDSLKTFVNVYFIGQNEDKEEVYKVAKRVYHGAKDGTKLKYSIKCLLKGPNKKEKTQGIYSEIPQGTKILSIQETPEKVIINLSSNFEQGGGTDALYKRIYQLIKTANKNTALDVYLYLDGKQVDVIGGEGIMINQPLNNNSLDEE